MDELKELEEQYKKQEELLGFLRKTFDAYKSMVDDERRKNAYLRAKVDEFNSKSKLIDKKVNLLRFMQIGLYLVAVYKGFNGLSLFITLPVAVVTTYLSNNLFDKVNDDDIKFINNFRVNHYQNQIDAYEANSVNVFESTNEFESEIINQESRLLTIKRKIDILNGDAYEEEVEPFKVYFRESPKVKKLTYNRNKN